MGSQRGIRQPLLWKDSAPGHVWQRRFYGFNVWSECKRIEKLRYMHRNPGSRASPVLACWGGSRGSVDWSPSLSSGARAASGSMPMERPEPCGSTTAMYERCRFARCRSACSRAAFQAPLLANPARNGAPPSSSACCSRGRWRSPARCRKGAPPAPQRASVLST
jgi:hypothetical protein